MSEQKKPQAGEWWFSGDMKHRMLCHGEAQQGRVIMEDHTGEVDAYERLNKSWHHEPRCTGWDWQPEPEPEWFDLTPFFSHELRPSVDHLKGIGRDFEPVRVSGYTVRAARHFGFTQFRCLLKDAPPELVAKANKPAEDPDEWVTQDRVPVRVGIDEFKYGRDNWSLAVEADNFTSRAVHGWGTLQVRCRRRDLPPMPEPKPKAEREVSLYWYDGNVVGRYADCPPTDPSFVPLIVRDGKVFIETETRDVVR